MEITKQGQQLYIDSSFIVKLNNYINAVPDPKTHHLHLFIVMAVMAAFLLPIICYWLRNTKEYSFGTYIEQLIATYIGYIVFMALPFWIYYFFFYSKTRLLKEIIQKRLMYFLYSSVENTSNFPKELSVELIANILLKIALSKLQNAKVYFQT